MMRWLALAATFGFACGLTACDDEQTTTQEPAIVIPDGLSPGNGKFSKFVLDDQANGPAFAELHDFNGDGRLDIVSSRFGALEGPSITPGELVVYYQGDRLDRWTKTYVFTPEADIYWPNEVEVHDIDGDGDADIAVGVGFLTCGILPRTRPDGTTVSASPCGGLLWFEQSGDEWIRHDVVAPTSNLFYHRPRFADIDGDGIEDMIAVGEERTLREGGILFDQAQAQWFKGIAGGDRFETTARSIGPGLGSLPTLIDLDGDGDLDIASAEYFAEFERKSFAWYEQIEAPSAANPTGSWTRHIIDDNVGPAIQLSFVENFLGNGQLVAIGSNHTQTTGIDPDPWESAVYLYLIPQEPRAAWSRRKISENIVSIPRAQQAAPGIFNWGDFDNDGDQDILLSGDGDTRIFVLRQNPGPSFETLVLDVDVPQAGSMNIADLDGDGQSELLASSFDNNELYIFYPDGAGPHPVGLAQQPEWAAPPSTLTELEISYTGDLEGPLYVAILDAWPPTTAPLFFTEEAAPSFPVSITSDFTDAGTYELLVYMDVDGSGNMGPSDADVQTQTTLTLPAAGPIVIDLDNGSGNGSGPGPMETDINVTVNYTGDGAGTVVIAAFPTLPPTQGPLKFAMVMDTDAFPVSGTLSAVPGETCQVLAFLDLEPFNPTFPDETDPQVSSALLSLDGNPIDLVIDLAQP